MRAHLLKILQNHTLEHFPSDTYEEPLTVNRFLSMSFHDETNKDQQKNMINIILHANNSYNNNINEDEIASHSSSNRSMVHLKEIFAERYGNSQTKRDGCILQHSESQNKFSSHSGTTSSVNPTPLYLNDLTDGSSSSTPWSQAFSQKKRKLRTKNRTELNKNYTKNKGKSQQRERGKKFYQANRTKILKQKKNKYNQKIKAAKTVNDDQLDKNSDTISNSVPEIPSTFDLKNNGSEKQYKTTS